MKRALLFVVLGCVAACSREQEQPIDQIVILPDPMADRRPDPLPSPEPEAQPEPPPPPPREPGARPIPAPFALPAPPRLVAMGDLHGDRQAAVNALRLAGAIDEAGHWIGGELVVVQVGDQLDRGDDERAILDWFEQLADEAHAAGGAFLPLLGNHETMNVQLDFRYVTAGGWAEFADVPGELPALIRDDYTAAERGRVAAFLPGGPYARLLAGHNMIQKVGDSVFVHGGIMPSHVRYGLDRINAEVQRWMRREGPQPTIIQGGDAPIWTRLFSLDTPEEACVTLENMLAELGARRLVVAHTVQDFGVNQACDGRVWRVDVGLAAYYGGPMEVLEIVGDRVTVLR